MTFFGFWGDFLMILMVVVDNFGMIIFMIFLSCFDDFRLFVLKIFGCFFYDFMSAGIPVHILCES